MIIEESIMIDAVGNEMAVENLDRSIHHRLL